MQPKVSIIIPCYNQGVFLEEAVSSVLAQTFQNFEIIVVNDGSTDEETNRILGEYQRPKTKVISTTNQGLAMARNNGIREARGGYILPLDADDRISSTYLEKSVEILDNNPRIGIVYCKAEFFGDSTGPWHAQEFSVRRMLLGNLIFCSALFRKSDWEAVGGYDTKMSIGYEDWDFWLSLIERGRGVLRIPEVLFYYRKKNVSMATSMSAGKKSDMHLQIMNNHKDLYIENMRPFLEIYYRVTCSLPYRIIKRFKLPYFAQSLLGK